MPCSGAFTPNPVTIHLPDRNIYSTTADPNIPVTVVWTSSAGCAFGGGKVSLFLVKYGVAQYCGSKVLSAMPLGTNYQTVYVTVPLGSNPSTGVHKVRRYVTGAFADGTVLTPQVDDDFAVSSHCS